MTPDMHTNPLLKSIDFGFQVQAFLESDIGRYLTTRAEADVADALENMKTVDPENPAAVRALQHQVHVAESVLYWLGEAVQAGINAEQELHDQSI